MTVEKKKSKGAIKDIGNRPENYLVPKKNQGCIGEMRFEDTLASICLK